MAKHSIAYIYPRSTTFVQKDIRLLDDAFKVIEFNGRLSSARSLPLLLIRQLFFLLLHPSCKVYVCMFAGYHALLPGLFARLLGKKMIIIAGGADAVSFPSLGYGNFRKNPLAWATAQSFRLSHHIAPVSESLIAQDSEYQQEFGPQGYKHFVKGLRTRSTPIANGYDAGFWVSDDSGRQDDLFLTVATHVETAARRSIKGLDLFLLMARKLPTYHFMIVGCAKTDLGALPSNVTVVEHAQPSELIKLYSRASYYVQLSVSEGFPNALCESMLCGCVPLVSAVGAMPEIVAETGYVLFEKRADAAVELFRQAVGNKSANPVLSEKARERVATLYTEEKRKSALTALIQYVISRK